MVPVPSASFPTAGGPESVRVQQHRFLGGPGAPAAHSGPWASPAEALPDLCLQHGRASRSTQEQLRPQNPTTLETYGRPPAPPAPGSPRQPPGSGAARVLHVGLATAQSLA